MKGNFINSMYIYNYVRKDGIEKKYFGIHEVVLGEFSQNRAKKKYETHIEKALAYPFHKEVKKQISHMSLQSFPTFLKNDKKTMRDEEDDRYYPFVLEFERGIANPEDAYREAQLFVFNMNFYYDVDLRDMVIILNNSKSIYVWINPKVFGLKPGKNIHNIYYNMYKKLKKEFYIDYVDESVVSSSYKLIKTPGSFYNGGYVNYITYNELNLLVARKTTKEELTHEQRDIRSLELPSVQSLKLTALYKSCKAELEEVVKKEKAIGLLPGDKKRERTCVRALLDLKIVEKGHRNNLLVTIALGLRDSGYDEEEIMDILETKAIEWQHDESVHAVRNKVKTLINRKTKFSCKKARISLEAIGMDHYCDTCINLEQKDIWISRSIIQKLYKNRASVRHFELYLNLEKNRLVEKSFSLEEASTSIRTLKELAKKLECTLEEKDGQYRLKVNRGKAKYKLPISFMDRTFYTMKNNVKQYLMLLVKAYDTNKDIASISMSTKSVTRYLGYKNVRSAEALLNKFMKLGLMKINKVITLFYKSYTIVSYEKKKKKKEKEKKEKPDYLMNKIKQIEFNIYYPEVHKKYKKYKKYKKLKCKNTG